MCPTQENGQVGTLEFSGAQHRCVHSVIISHSVIEQKEVMALVRMILLDNLVRQFFKLRSLLRLFFGSASDDLLIKALDSEDVEEV